MLRHLHSGFWLDMQRQLGARPLCKCGTVRVDNSDSVETDGRTVVVHGLHHCFTHPVGILSASNNNAVPHLAGCSGEGQHDHGR